MQNKDWKAFIQESINKLVEYKTHANWVKNADSPCLTYSMQIQGRIASKGELQVNHSIDKIQTFLADPQTQKKLADNLQSVTVLLQGEGYRITNMKYKGSWPVSPRDFVMFAARTRRGDVLYVTSRSVDYPCAEESGTVRAQCHIGGYIVQKTGENTSRVTYISDADVKGSIPGMIKNKLSKGQAIIPSKLNDALNGK